MKMLGTRKAKKALLKNGSNVKEIYNMYYEKENYKVLYPDKEEIRQKYKYHVADILKKFNINSLNEMIFLLRRVHKPIKYCEFCSEYIYKFPTRTGIHSNDCRHIGMCVACNKPQSWLNEQGSCSWCWPPLRDDPMRLLGLTLNLIQYSKEDLLSMRIDSFDLQWIINYLNNKLEIFMEILEEREFMELKHLELKQPNEAILTNEN